ncbi:MAG: hypothetical protein Q7S26_00395 [bacterium]|nr:hypothetical protein [bacterium]
MQWFLETSQRESEKNGRIIVRQEPGYPRVLVDGYSETSIGLNEIWYDALVRLPVRQAGAQAHLPEKVANILILGLGAGGMLKEVYTLFPHCHITAVEHDPEMVALTKELKLYEPFPLPNIVEEDAGAYVSVARETYDLIAVDLFRGGEPSPLLLDTDFLYALQKKMLDDGVLLINVANTEEYLSPAIQHFAHSETWKFRYNHLGMFWN